MPVWGGRSELSETGVYFLGKDKDGNEQLPLWICAPLRVIAKTRDEKSGQWGRLLDGRMMMAIPINGPCRSNCWKAMAQTLGANLPVLVCISRLISPHVAAGCVHQGMADRGQSALCRPLGWHGSTFVTPTGSMGEAEELVVFQNSHAIEPAYAESGTAEDIRRDVLAALATGNTRLVFALSVAFAAALAEISGEDSGGFHLRGASSSGKSTALKLAASVWGNPRPSCAYGAVQSRVDRIWQPCTTTVCLYWMKSGR